MSLKTRVVFLKSVPKGTLVSYGASYRTKKAARLATLPIGYADGLGRGLSNRGFVLIGGRRRPIVGRITMDMTIVDVTQGPPVRVGDEGVILGRQGSEEISFAETAREVGTIPYEISCAVSARVPRVHMG